MENYVICQICGEKVSRIYGAHLKKHGMTSEEYKKKYTGFPLMCKKDLENTTKNSGKHMKQEKYKKMFSEKIKGEKNPNHKSKTTEKERKERSPFTKDFYKKKGSENIEKDLMDFRDSALKDREFDTRIDYYLDRGFSLKESKKLLKERQTTFTLEKCIEKYGKEKGIEIYNNRQEKWQKSLNENGNLKQGYSNISQELFYKLLEYYNIDDKKDIYFATKNEEYRLNKISGGIYIYDFTDIKNKKIIEYNGDQYHANPKIYKSNDMPHPFRKTILAKDIWQKDKKKIITAKKEGFDVLIIWDSEYNKKKKETIRKCLNFLNF